MGEALIVRRGGGANLNFRVNQYPEATDLSQITGKENEIAVLTDNKIDSWQFSYTEPENPTTGMVWIKLANTGHAVFNALKKNAIILGGAAAFQYLTGEWQPKHAQIYQDGGWNDFRHYLFREGLGQIIQWKGNVAVFTDNDITVGATSGSKVGIATFDMFDFSNFSNLFVDMTPNFYTQYSYKFAIIFTRRNQSGWWDDYSSTQAYSPTGATQSQMYPLQTTPIINGTRATIKLGITNAVKESPCFLFLQHYYNNSPYAFKVHNIWLE